MALSFDRMVGDANVVAILGMGVVTKMHQVTNEIGLDTDLVFEGYRRWGYLAANLDPLGFLTPIVHPELIVDGPAAATARKFYCGTIGAEFEHIDDTARRRWISDRLESDAPTPD